MSSRACETRTRSAHTRKHARELLTRTRTAHTRMHHCVAFDGSRPRVNWQLLRACWVLNIHASILNTHARGFSRSFKWHFKCEVENHNPSFNQLQEGPLHVYIKQTRYVQHSLQYILQYMQYILVLAILKESPFQNKPLSH